MRLRTFAAFLLASVFSLSALSAQSTQSAPAPPAASAPSRKVPAADARKPLSEVAAAPGGGPGQVWVNTASKVYHCAGTAYYGKTKAGKYMTEDAAKSEGDRANGGKPCSK